MTLSDPVVQEWQGIHVVRDDLLSGGTKRRFLDGFVASAGAEFVYATPAYGGAQIALAFAARASGKRATLFVAKRAELHPRTREAQLAGAKVVEVPHGYLSNVQSKARAYCEATGAILLPFGLDTAETRAAIASAARLVRLEHGVFDEVWSVIGSGTLARALQDSGLGRFYFGVAVGKESDAGEATVIRHPQPFDADAKVRPPFPSCSNYDAKAWQHLIARRITNWPRRMLFWNVMG